MITILSSAFRHATHGFEFQTQVLGQPVTVQAYYLSGALPEPERQRPGEESRFEIVHVLDARGLDLVQRLSPQLIEQLKQEAEQHLISKRNTP